MVGQAGQRQGRPVRAQHDPRNCLVHQPRHRRQELQRVQRGRDLWCQQSDQIGRLRGYRGGTFGDHTQQAHVPMVRREQADPEALPETSREQVLTPQRDLRRVQVQIHQPSRAGCPLQTGQFDVLQEPGAVVIGVGAVVEAAPAHRHVHALARGKQGDRAGFERNHPLHLGQQGFSSFVQPTASRGEAGDLGQDRHGVRREIAHV
jgi:hypothetical protein